MLKRIIRKLFTEQSTLQGLVAHTPHGLLTVFLAVYVHWSIALLFGIGFIVYELMQEWRLENDLAGWLLGMVIGGIIYWVI